MKDVVEPLTELFTTFFTFKARPRSLLFSDEKTFTFLFLKESEVVIAKLTVFFSVDNFCEFVIEEDGDGGMGGGDFGEENVVDEDDETRSCDDDVAGNEDEMD